MIEWNTSGTRAAPRRLAAADLRWTRAAVRAGDGVDTGHGCTGLRRDPTDDRPFGGRLGRTGGKHDMSLGRPHRHGHGAAGASEAIMSGDGPASRARFGWPARRSFPMERTCAPSGLADGVGRLVGESDLELL